jgi:hypothetical protein
MKGDQIAGIIDNKIIATITDKSGLKGMTFIASTYDRNLFDNILVEPFTP